MMNCYDGEDQEGRERSLCFRADMRYDARMLTGSGSITIAPGTTVNFSVQIAGGLAPFTYTWFLGDPQSRQTSVPQTSQAYGPSPYAEPNNYWPVQVAVADASGAVVRSGVINIYITAPYIPMTVVLTAV